jgi:hypothetical protein
MTARICLLFSLLISLSSCSSLNRLAKAGAAKPSAFLAHGAELKKTRPDQEPFLYIWRNPSEQVLEKAETKKHLYIAPVSLEHLRPMSKALSIVEIRENSRQQRAVELAEYMRTQFANAFRQSANPKYQIVEEPQKDALHLELAIIELNPNAISAGVTRRAINLIAVPGAEAVVGRPLKGNIAIEGRLWDPGQKESLYEFADAEHNRSALILSVHDYNAYSSARKIIRDWASQFEQVTRTPPGGQVKDSPAFTLWLW